MGSFTKLQKRIEKIQDELLGINGELSEMWENIDRLKEVFRHHSEENKLMDKLNKIRRIINDGWRFEKGKFEV